MRNLLPLLGIAAALALGAGCDATSGPAHEAPLPPIGVGQNLAANTACLACHADVAARWALPSSHGQLLDCAHCHTATAPEGPGHADDRGCADCHSQATHPAGAACDSCHEPHGTQNAFLVRDSITVPGGGDVDVHLTAPEGASADGLARAGADGGVAGTGVCEVCHATTRYYDRAGDGQPHDQGWCPQCHLHQNGYLLGLP